MRPTRAVVTTLLLAVLLVVPIQVDAAGPCSIYQTVATGDSLTASYFNNSFSTVGVTNMIVTCMDDYSATTAQMRTTTDPYPSNSESLATTLAGELERLRYQIQQIHGRDYWYQDPSPLVPPGDIHLGVVSSRSALLQFFHASSAFATTFRAAVATAAADYVWPTGPPTVSGYALTSTTAGVMSWASVGAAGAITFAGADDTENTTTSTTQADLCTVGSLSITTAQTAKFVVAVRKTAGGAFSASLGLKVNATQVIANGNAWASGTNQAEFGYIYGEIGPRDATYVRSGFIARANGTTTGTSTFSIDGTDVPNATITSLTLTGYVGDASVTMACNYMRVYAVAAS